MSIDIQRERRCSMSQIVLYGLNIVPAFQRSNCISVSEIMESLVFDPKIFDDIPLKKEIKVSASGIYINRIISVRGGKVPEPQKKKGFFSRITNR